MDAADGEAVVVGVDGSPQALRAVRWAAAEAARRHRPLKVVHGFIWPMLRVSGQPPPGAPPGAGLRNQAERLVKEAVAEARAVTPGLPITARIVDGEAGAVLLREAPTAALIVLGEHGLGGVTAILVGSVAVQVASHADCPVLVVRGQERRDGPVVVGVDGTPLCRRAVEFAADQAVARNTDLLAVHAYRHPPTGDHGDPQPLVYDRAQLRAEEEQVVAESLSGLARQHPGLTVHRRVVRGRAARALIDASAQAQLVVVGARGRSALTGLLRGSVSHAVLHRSGCPTVLVPQRD